MKIKEEINKVLLDSISIKKEIITTDAPELSQIALTLIECIKEKGKIIIFGNGGSASDSQHIAAELVGRFQKERRPLPAVSLTANTSSLSAIANDYGFDEIFSRQLMALAQENDVVWGISTSGNSPNVIKAIKKAKELGFKTIVFTGGSGGELRELADSTFIVPSSNTARIQEVHITVAHALCNLIEKAFLND